MRKNSQVYNVNKASVMAPKTKTIKSAKEAITNPKTQRVPKKL